MNLSVLFLKYDTMSDKIEYTKKLIKQKNVVAFSGAGISIASGMPAFRGIDGLWSKYNPEILDIDFFLKNPKISWQYIKEIFYNYLKNIKPNPAHYAIASAKYPVITQNIDNLHQDAGSIYVVEFHGNAKILACLSCGSKFNAEEKFLEKLPPVCPKCSGLLKPDFVFFKEPIPKNALDNSIQLAKECDVMLVIGTTGEIMPASQIPYIAKENGAFIIEINVNKSNYTESITDIFLQGKAEEVLPLIV